MNHMCPMNHTGSTIHISSLGFLQVLWASQVLSRPFWLWTKPARWSTLVLRDTHAIFRAYSHGPRPWPYPWSFEPHMLYELLKLYLGVTGHGPHRSHEPYRLSLPHRTTQVLEPHSFCGSHMLPWPYMPWTRQNLSTTRVLQATQTLDLTYPLNETGSASYTGSLGDTGHMLNRSLEPHKFREHLRISWQHRLWTIPVPRAIQALLATQTIDHMDLLNHAGSFFQLTRATQSLSAAQALDCTGPLNHAGFTSHTALLTTQIT